MSIFRCWKCDKTVDADIDNAAEIDNHLVCEDCYCAWEEGNESE